MRPSSWWGLAWSRERLAEVRELQEGPQDRGVRRRVADLPRLRLRPAAQVGATVAAGDVLVVLEAMKMEHAVRAGAAGSVAEVHVAAGDQVDAGALLAVVTPA